MRTILATNNSEIFYETKGTAYLGVVENGKIILGDAGFEFEYKNPRRGQIFSLLGQVLKAPKLMFQSVENLVSSFL